MKKLAVVAIVVVVWSLVLPIIHADAAPASALLSRISALEVTTRADKAAAAINRKDLADSLINTLTKAQAKAAAGDAAGAQTLLDAFAASVQANYGTKIYFKAADRLLGLANTSVAPDVTTVTPGVAATVSASAGGGSLAVSIPAGTKIGIVDIDPPTVPNQLTPPVAQQLLGSAVVRAYDKTGVPVTVPEKPLTLTFTVTGGQWTVSQRAELDTVDPKTLQTQRLASQTSSGNGSVTVTAQTKHLSPFAVNAPSSSGVITSFAGGPGEGDALDVDQNVGRVVARGGTLYVADDDRGVIRAVDLASGRETVFAGAPGRWDPSEQGDGGPATAAGFGRPEGMAFDSAGNLFVADSGSGRVRRIDPSGTITTVATNLNQPMDVAIDSAGALWIADTANNRLLTGPVGGPYHTVASVPQTPRALAADASGHVYVATNPTFFDYTLRIYDIDVVHGTTSTLLQEPNTDPVTPLALDHAGHLLVGGYQANKVRSIDLATNAVSTFAGTGVADFSGDGHPATAATLWGPYGLTVDDLGSVFIADSVNLRIRRVDFAGIISTAVGTGHDRTVGGVGDGGAAASAQFYFPLRVATDHAGNVYVTEDGNETTNRVRKIDTAGTITTFASKLGSLGGIAVDANGNVFVGEQDVDDNEARILKFKPDGSRSTFTSDVLDAQGMAVDAGGNLLVADNLANQVVRFSPTGVKTVVATDPGFTGFSALTVDAAGTIYVASGATVFKITPTGAVSTFAGTGVPGDSGDGGPATAAQLRSPSALAIAPDGGVLIGDVQVPRVRAVGANGNITTVVGNGAFGNSGNGGPALQARITDTYGLAYDTAGNLYLADSTAACVRRVEA
jgi:sugar lactone lactonase YvrE